MKRICFQSLQQEKHVGFDVDSDTEDDNFSSPDDKHNLKLQRRDTPHHLKNKRVVTEAPDSTAIRALLGKVRRFSHDVKIVFQVFHTDDFFFLF